MRIQLTATLDHHLTDEEFVSRYETVGRHSPVIEALMVRLDRANRTHTIPEDIANRVECPVCMAELHVEMDENNGMFSLHSQNI